MLDRIDIKSFKSIREASIELGSLNVFIGANGSGKSNLLEAIGVLGAAAAGRVDDEALLRRGVRPGVPALYKASFRGERVRNAIRFGAFKGDGSYEVELINPTNQPRPAWSYKTEKLWEGDYKVVGRSPASANFQALDQAQGLAALEAVKLTPTSVASQLLRGLRDFAIYAPNTSTLRGLVTDPQSRVPVGLSGGRLAEAVEDLRRLARTHEGFEDIINDVLELIDWVDVVGAKPGSSVPLSPTTHASSRYCSSATASWRKAGTNSAPTMRAKARCTCYSRRSRRPTPTRRRCSPSTTSTQR
ncbi:AAA family ATPase [Haliangium sp.]|uniref:AAA family ATPase n=1 Tax=Haliangium sp. TaxID=2663208 RepID=UPI003D0D22F1